MTFAPKDSQQYSEVSQRLNSTSVSSMVISLLTGPLLLTLMGARVLSDGLTQVGIASEEFFRGERLPDLNYGSSSRSPEPTLNETEGD